MADAKSQKVIIKIGHLQLLLPDDTGAAQVLKTLSRGIPCWESLYRKQVQIRSDDAPEITLSYVPHKTTFVDEQEQPIAPVEKKKGRTLALKPPAYLELMERRADNHGA